jgi:hypothetical protein
MRIALLRAVHSCSFDKDEVKLAGKRRSPFEEALQPAWRATVKSALVILISTLLSEPVLGAAAVGVARSSATATVTLSIPSLYGIRVPEEGDDSTEAGGFRRASLRQQEADQPAFRFAVLSTVGEGRVALRRLVDEGFSLAGNRIGSQTGTETSMILPASSFGWKGLEDRVSPSRLSRASRGGNHNVPTVVYELWQF